MDIITVFETAGRGSIPLSPAIPRRFKMKPTTFKNRLNNEQVVCEDVRKVERIDDIEYLVVHRPENNRMFLMRKDALEKINIAVVKGISRNFAKV